MLDFPSSPTINQVFVAPNGIAWAYDGIKWAPSPNTGAYLPLIGGTLTGPLLLNADPTSPLGASTKQYSDLKLPLAGGTMTGELILNESAAPAIRINGPSGDWPGIELWAKSGEGNYIFSAVNNNGRWEIDLGNAATESGSNSGSNFQIVRYADNGNTIDEPLIINRQNGQAYFGQPLQAPNGLLNGFVNKFINGDMLIWQRGSPITVAAGTAAFAADRFIVAATGATCTVSFGARLGSTACSRGSLTMAGIAGLTQTNIQQRIDSYTAAPLAGRQCVFQCRVFNNTANAITPQLATYTMNSQDVASPNTVDLAVTNLQTIAAGATAIVSYSFPVSVNATNGYIVQLLFGNALNGASISLSTTDWDIRTATAYTTGLVSNPPPPEQRPVGVESTICRRYFQTCQMYLYLAGITCAAGVTFAYGSLVPVQMRATPTATITANNNANISSPQVIYSGGMIYVTGTATAAGGTALNMNFTLAAEI